MIAILESRCCTLGIPEERLHADYAGTGVNMGRHSMFYRRAEMNERGVTPAAGLARIGSGSHVRIVGCVIVRQRPGTAKGIVFLSIEDETGIANPVVMPGMFAANRLLVAGSPCYWLKAPYRMSNVIHGQAKNIEPLRFSAASAPSHDFH